MSLNVAVGPGDVSSWLTDAVRRGGGTIVDPEAAEIIVWEDHEGTGLQATLRRAPGVRWVQLPAAGIEWLFADGVHDPAITWTCAKGAYAGHAAEMALLLLLSGLRQMRGWLRAERWLPEAGVSLFDRRVCIVGGGGIASVLVELLRPFRVDTTIVRRTDRPLEGAGRTLTVDRLDEALGDVDAVILACSLTPQTTGMIGERQLRAMRDDAWLVNVGRGRLVVTDALVRALTERWIGGAAIDVTEPEPLPAGHPLWSLDNCIVTPHVANPLGLSGGPLSERIEENMRRYTAGEELVGVVDPGAGY